MNELYCIQKVQGHWHRYTEKMDRMVEEAFRLNVKWSLQELSRSINGDGKSGPNPLFKVKVVLEGDKVRFNIFQMFQYTKYIDRLIQQKNH